MTIDDAADDDDDDDNDDGGDFDYVFLHLGIHTPAKSNTNAFKPGQAGSFFLPRKHPSCQGGVENIPIWSAAIRPWPRGVLVVELPRT